MNFNDNPSPHILLNFIGVFSSYLNLGQLDPKRGFIDQELLRIYNLIAQGKIQGIDGAHAALFKFRFLLKDLDILRMADSSYLKKFTNNIVKCPMQQYYGIRLEIHIAASFHEKSIEFTCPDPPDFKIGHKGKNVNIECTSRNLTVKKNKSDVIKGFRTAIENKKTFKFVSENSALFIDCTNLAYNNGSLFWDDYNSTRSYLKQELDKTNFGAVLTFSWVWNIKYDRYEVIYSRIDAETTATELSDFLNLYYPFGQHLIEKGYANIPSIG